MVKAFITSAEYRQRFGPKDSDLRIAADGKGAACVTQVGSTDIGNPEYLIVHFSLLQSAAGQFRFVQSEEGEMR